MLASSKTNATHGKDATPRPPISTPPSRPPPAMALFQVTTFMDRARSAPSRAASANLRLPALRFADDHHRHTPTQQAYPGTTCGARPPMNAIVSGSTNRLSALRQREPKGDACAYRSKQVVWRGPSQPDSAPSVSPPLVSLSGLRFTWVAHHHTFGAADQIAIAVNRSGPVGALCGFLPRGL